MRLDAVGCAPVSATLTEADREALHHDLDAWEANPRVRKFAPVVAIPTAPHKCRACCAIIPARTPCVSRTMKKPTGAWNFYFCLPCSPFTVSEVRPLADRRALRWAAGEVARARSVAEVPAIVWRVLDGLRNAAVPF